MKPRDEPHDPSKPFGFDPGTIEHRQMPDGGRSLIDYELQLGFDRHELEGKRVLDLGAGTDTKLAVELQESGIRAEVVSFSPDFVDPQYAEKAKEPGVGSLAAGIGQQLPFKDESFDAILSLHVSDHLWPADHFAFVKEMARVLTKGGTAWFGPQVNIPGEWDLYDMLQHESLAPYFEQQNITIEKALIPEEIMPLEQIKDSMSFAHYEQAYNVVLKKAA